MRWELLDRRENLLQLLGRIFSFVNVPRRLGELTLLDRVLGGSDFFLPEV